MTGRPSRKMSCLVVVLLGEIVLRARKSRFYHLSKPLIIRLGAVAAGHRSLSVRRPSGADVCSEVRSVTPFSRNLRNGLELVEMTGGAGVPVALTPVMGAYKPVLDTHRVTVLHDCQLYRETDEY